VGGASAAGARGRAAGERARSGEGGGGGGARRRSPLRPFPPPLLPQPPASRGPSSA
jgi:hypothetical protein